MSRALRAFLALLLASLLCVALVELRIRHTGDPFYRFLVWNLFLAWIPFLLALGLYDRARRGRFGIVSAALAVLWLLFFPNAPYMLTDFIHLNQTQTAPLWFDALMVSSFAWTALLLGFASLYLVHVVVRRMIGLWSWLGVVAVLGVSSFGVYLGRFVRVNSWDALVRPGRLVQIVRTQVESPLSQPRMVAALVVLTGFMTVGYLVVYSFAGLRLELEPQRRNRDPEGWPVRYT